MNNKGFAITSVIYGLSILGIMIVMILMGTLSSTRNNVSEEAKRVEEFLIAFNQTKVSYHTTGTHIYEVPVGETGWYRFEAFGGKSCSGDGNGAYTTGIIFLNEKDRLSLTVGGCGSTTIVKMASTGEVIMSAGGGNGNSPGGTLRCYSSPPLGGEVDVNTFGLITPSKTFTGTDDVNFSSCSNSSYIRGYPGSGTGTWDYYFVDGLMLAGANSASNGKVLIERLAERDDTISTIPRKNKKFDNASSISVSVPSNIHVDSIYYSYHDDYAGSGFKGHVVKCSSTSYCTISPAKNIDDISILFAESNYKTNLKGITVSIGSNVVYSSHGTEGVNGGPTGIHLSAYQPDTYDSNISNWSDNFAPHGNYYIIPIVSENKVISAAENAADDADKLKIEPISGDSRQRWAIDLINTPDGSVKVFNNISNASGRKEYRIMELTRYKAMNIYYDENYRLNFISAPETFNSLSRNEPQIWNIYPMSDGTCAIKTVVESFDPSRKSGFLFAKTRGVSVNNIDDIMIGGASNSPDNEYEALPTSVERFILYSLDFSK